MTGSTVRGIVMYYKDYVVHYSHVRYLADVFISADQSSSVSESLSTKTEILFSRRRKKTPRAQIKISVAF